MIVYRTGAHHGVTIVAEDDGVIFCGREGHDCARGHLVGMVGDGQFLTGDPHLAARVHALLRCGPDYRHDSDWALAERICALLNGNPRGYHPTCVETTTRAELVAGERSFVCGLDCPPPPAVGHTEGHR